MTEPNEQYAYFTLIGDFDPGEISRTVGVQPTECWRKGDVNPRTHLERKFNRWSLYSRLDRTNSLEAHIEDVLQQLGSSKQSFAEVTAKYRGVMQVVAYFNTDYPGLHLEDRIVRALGAYGLGVDFDFYFRYSATREDS